MVTRGNKFTSLESLIALKQYTNLANITILLSNNDDLTYTASLSTALPISL